MFYNSILYSYPTVFTVTAVSVQQFDSFEMIIQKTEFRIMWSLNDFIHKHFYFYGKDLRLRAEGKPEMEKLNFEKVTKEMDGWRI